MSAQKQGRRAMRQLVPIALLLWVAAAGAQEYPTEQLLEDEEWLETTSAESPPVPTKAGTFSCSPTGCTGTFSAMVQSLRTINNGDELIILHDVAADALRSAGGCTSWTGNGIIVDGTAKAEVVNKLQIGLALDTRFHLRVFASGTECKIFYVRLFTPA